MICQLDDQFGDKHVVGSLRELIAVPHAHGSTNFWTDSQQSRKTKP